MAGRILFPGIGAKVARVGPGNLEGDHEDLHLSLLMRPQRILLQQRAKVQKRIEKYALQAVGDTLLEPGEERLLEVRRIGMKAAESAEWRLPCLRSI